MQQRPRNNHYKQKINSVLIYIQNNIQTCLTLEKLADVASISPYHFHRIFSAHIGESLHAYIKRLRLENAAFRLCHTRESVTNIAMTSGYASLASFTKAFGKHFGESPNNVRSRGKLASREINHNWPYSSENLPSTHPDIQSLPDQTVLFVRRTGEYQDAAKSAWESLMRFAYSSGLLQQQNIASIGITYDSPEITHDEYVRYDACLVVDSSRYASENFNPDGEVGIQTLKGGEYAVFQHTGPYESLWVVYKMIYGEWLHQSNIALRNSPSFAQYLNDPTVVSPEMLKTNIYIPIEYSQ